MKTLRSGFIWNLSGIAVYGASQWAMLIILAKYGSVQLVGQFGLALAISAPIFQFSNLGLRALLGTDTHRSYDFKVYLHTRVITALVSLGLIILFAKLLGFSWETSIIVSLVAIAKVAESVSDLLFGELQLLQRIDLVGRSLIFKGPLTLIVFYFGLNSDFGFLFSFLGMAVIWILLLIIYDARNVRSLRQQLGIVSTIIGKNDYKILIIQALPLGFFASLTSLMSSIPRWFLESNYGEDAVGYFTAIAYIMVVGMMFSTALQQTVSPRLANLFKDRKLEFVKLTFKLMGLGGCIGIMGIIFAHYFGSLFLQVFYGTGYGVYDTEFTVIMVGGMAMYIQSFVNAGLIASRAIRLQGWQAGTGVIVCLILCLYLVPKFGVMGASIAMSASIWASLIFAITVLIFTLKKRPINE